MSSISFDRAADYYDATRSLSPGAAAEVTRLLRGELVGHEPCLEIGVGTGRVAIPLASAGVAMVGIDLSRPMLDRLSSNASGQGSLPLAVGDALELSFASGSVGAVIGCHVLHLISDWRRAVSEVIRVLRPGGVFLLDMGGGPRGAWRQIVARVGRELDLRRPRPGLVDLNELDQVMARSGVVRQPLPEVVERVTRPLSDAFDELSAQVHSWTWQVSEAAMRDAVTRTRSWAEGNLGSLDETRTVERSIRWWKYQF